MHYVRAATMSDFKATIDSLNLDFDALMFKAELDSNSFTPEFSNQYIPIAKLEKLFAMVEDQSGCYDIAAKLGRQQELSPSLGVLGFVILHSKTVGEALKQLKHYFSFQLQGAFLHIHFHGLYAALSFTVQEAHLLPSVRNTNEFAVATGISIFRTLCGPQWKPSRVEFLHENPDSNRNMRDIYLSSVHYNQERNAIVFPAHHLLKTIRKRPEKLERILQANIDFLESHYTNDFPMHVEQLIYQAIYSGDCSIQNICNYLKMKQRTFSRKLQESNTNFQFLLKKVRMDIACNVLKQTSMSYTQLSILLCYTELSAFTRAFKNWTNLSPGEWQIQNKK